MADLFPETLTTSERREYQTLKLELAVAAKPLDPGTPGVCEDCDADSPRLVFGLCAPCRDILAKQQRAMGARE